MNLFSISPNRLHYAGMRRLKSIIAVPVILLLLCGIIQAQDSVTEGQIAALFASGGSTTPLFTTNNPFFLSNDNSGNVASAAYNLGGGMYLYAYEFDCSSPVTYTVTQLNVPLGGSMPVPAGAVTTGTFWTGAGPAGFAPYSGPFAVFNGFQTFGVDPSTDPITGVFVSPTSVTFGAPGIFSINNGLPQGVFLTTPVFGFITNTAPQLVTGGYALDANGNPLPAIQIVAPQGPVTLVDPVSSLLSGPAVTANPDMLATQGRLISGVAADGVTQIVIRIGASNVGDQFTLNIQNFTSTAEMGALGNPGDSMFSANTLTVTAVQTSKGPMAFAIYQAPLDFPRAGGKDAGATTRDVSLQLQPPGNGASTTTKITVIRPPVVLIHGLWSDPATWNNFAPLFGASGADPRFFVKTANYSAPVTITASNPTYSNSVLRSAHANALGFSFNAPSVLSQIRNYVQTFKNGQNPAGIQAAAIQADLVGHSMGGDITRTLPLVGNYASNDTFGQGVIHKAVTIGTPHLGSPLAVDFFQNANTCVRNQFAGRGNIAFLTATTPSGTVNGAVGDLQGDGNGGGLSAALQNIQQAGPIPVPTALIAAATTANNLNSLNCTFCIAELFRLRCSGNPMADNLTPQGWNTLFSNQPNDAIVPQSSELNLLSGFVVTGFIHTNSLTALDFTGPDELDPTSGIPNQVINLLNTPVTDSRFNSLAP